MTLSPQTAQALLEAAGYFATGSFDMHEAALPMVVNTHDTIQSENARLREQVKELREGLAWIEKIADMNFEQDEKLRADGARTLKRISDRARDLMEKTNG